MHCALEAASQGLGLACVYRRLAEEYIRSGRLVALLEEHCAATEGFYLYYHERAPIPRKLQAFVEFMQAVNTDAEPPAGAFAGGARGRPELLKSSWIFCSPGLCCAAGV